jgi:hypothetical protein
MLRAALSGVLMLAGAGAALADLNQQVLAYANSQLGATVGDGQCWTLADQALAYAGAHRPGVDGYGVNVFGRQIPVNQVRPGDVIQFEGVRFDYPDGSWMEMPHHTAIVEAVQGSKIQVIQQNFGNTPQERVVRTTWLDLSAKTRGTMTYFRPQPK